MNNVVYALDFDGVICDSAVETALTGWKAAAAIWRDMPEAVPPEAVARFRAIRPIIETGYEAILAMRLLHLGENTADMFQNFTQQSQTLLAEAQVTVEDLKTLFGATRDAWIARDLDGWIAMNPLFDGVAEKLRRLTAERLWFVVTTKQERFARHILHAHAVDLPRERIFGLDRQMSKVEVLLQLLEKHPGQTLCFVEDRLPTLQNVRRHDGLAEIKTLFALWGYNTADDKAAAARQGFPGVKLADFLTAQA